jgi:hypothetical protein
MFIYLCDQDATLALQLVETPARQEIIPRSKVSRSSKPCVIDDGILEG